MLAALVATYLPGVESVVREHDIELSLITLHWYVTLFASVLHMKILLRVWDLFFLDGSIVLFEVTLAMLKIKGKLRLYVISFRFYIVWPLLGTFLDIFCECKTVNVSFQRQSSVALRIQHRYSMHCQIFLGILMMLIACLR